MTQLYIPAPAILPNCSPDFPVEIGDSALSRGLVAALLADVDIKNNKQLVRLAGVTLEAQPRGRLLGGWTGNAAQYVEDASVPKFNGTAFSIAFDYYYKASATAIRTFISQGGSGAGGSGWNISIQGATYTDLYFTFGGVADYALKTAAFAIGEHARLLIVCTGNGGQALAYKNGALLGSVAIGTQLGAGAAPTRIGVVNNGTGNIAPLSGISIGNLNIWNRGLSAQDALDDYNNSFAIFRPKQSDLYLAYSGPGSSAQVEPASATDTQAGALVTSSAQAESATAADASSAAIVTATAQAEPASATDSQNNALTANATQSETGTATDAQSNTLTANGTQSEASTAADTQSNALAANATQTEAATATDTQDAPASGVSTQAESATAIDAQAVAVTYAATQAEPSSATDAATGSNVTSSTLAEAATATDTANATSGAIQTQTEAASAVDTNSASVVYAASSVEVVTATDSVISVANFLAAVAEYGTAADLITAGGFVSAGIIELATAIDATNTVGSLVSHPTQWRINAAGRKWAINATGRTWTT